MNYFDQSKQSKKYTNQLHVAERRETRPSLNSEELAKTMNNDSLKTYTWKNYFGVDSKLAS